MQAKKAGKKKGNKKPARNGAKGRTGKTELDTGNGAEFVKKVKREIANEAAKRAKAVAKIEHFAAEIKTKSVKLGRYIKLYQERIERAKGRHKRELTKEVARQAAALEENPRLAVVKTDVVTLQGTAKAAPKKKAKKKKAA